MENGRRMIMSMVDLMGENSSRQVNQGKVKEFTVTLPPPQTNNVDEPSSEHPMDPKKLKRMKINREASKRLREKKEEKLMRMEGECEYYENQVKMGVVGMEKLNNQKQTLTIDNEQLKAQIISLEQYYELKQVEEVILRQERDELKKLHITQILQMLVQQQEEEEEEDMFMMNAQISPNQGN